MDSRLPPAEIPVDEDLVRALLNEQHPDLAALELAFIDEGWDNVTYRLGPQLAVRVPRRAVAADLLRNEQRWLPILAPRLNVAVPIPERLGVPCARFPWPWSVVPWIAGTSADREALQPEQAGVVGEFLLALHRPAPLDAPSNPLRGVPLQSRARALEERLTASKHLSAEDLARLRGIWRAGLEAPSARDRVWLHGDLHPRNVVVERGALAGVLDWGDITAGDRATDLACAWMLFPSARARTRLFATYGASRASQARARAWAVFFGTALAGSSEARHMGMGRDILDRLLADPCEGVPLRSSTDGG